MKPLTLDEAGAWGSNDEMSVAVRRGENAAIIVRLATQLAATMRELATEREARGRMEAVGEAAREADKGCPECIAFLDGCSPDFECSFAPMHASLAALDAQRIAGAK